MIYREKLKELREYEDIKQKELAEIIGISNAALSEFEREKTIMPIKHLVNIANYFNVSLDYIFSFNKEKSYKNIKEINNIEAGKRLKEFRKNNKITQTKLAELLNTNQSVIANYERGRNYIATPFLYTICKKYNVSADYLLGRIDK